MSSAGSTAATAARKESISVEELPQELSVVDCEKRRGVSRHYAYVIEVTRKNREKYYIYRRYRQFHKMTQRLEERFPVEAGSIRASDRILPLLPGKKYIGRSAVRDVAEIRLPYLDSFLKKLYAMSDKIRYDSIVIAFLRPNHEDINKPYKGRIAYPVGRTNGTRDGSTSPPERPRPPRLSPTKSPNKPLPPSKPLPPNKPLPVPVIQVSASSSSKPAKPPPPRPTPPRFTPPTQPKGPRAKAIYNYTPHYDDEISLKAGSIITLLRKMDGDWYEGKTNGQIGLVPGNYLDIIEPLPLEDDELSEETDEWDEEDTGKISCQYKGKTIIVNVDSELIKRPVFNKLIFAVRSQLKNSRVTLNYKDSTGDLIEIVDNTDLELMKDIHKKEHRSSKQNGMAPWTLYITTAGDCSMYRTDPYQ